MPKGPNGQKRPADAIGLAVMVAKIATGEIKEEGLAAPKEAAKLGSIGGKKRAESMAPAQRSAIAKAAAQARWASQSAPSEEEGS
jgi:hypothetical protein